MSDNKKPTQPDCVGCVFPGNCPCFDAGVTVPAETLRILLRRHITIDIPAPCDFINSNHRQHRMAQAKLTKTWRQASAAAAHGLPPFTGQVHITAHIFKPRAGRWDPNNLWPTVKAAVDGLVDAGLLIDDDHRHVIGPDMRSGGKGNPEVVLEIIETGTTP